MEYEITVLWDAEASVWVALNDVLPLSLESGSLDRLMEKVRYTAFEMAEANHLAAPEYLHFRVDALEKVGG